MRAIATRPSTDAVLPGATRVQAASRFAAFVLLGAMLFGPAVQAAPSGHTEMADTALVLAVDVSGSMNAERYALQMEGIAKAFEDRDVERTILSGPHRAMFVTLVEWSDTAAIAVPWTLIASEADAQAFANKIRRAPRADNHFTCMSRALQLVDDKVLPFLPVSADRTVIDVSGDGRDNCNSNPPVEAMRDRIVGEGFTINGLPILDGDEATTLEAWYKAHVIGGNAAFVEPARGFADFARAMRQKFIVEISSARAP